MDFLTLIHIIIAIILILLVLVQDSKGAMGSTFGGGGSQTLFGATGMDNVLTKSTKIIVVFFAITCILLTRLSSKNRGSVLDVEGHRPTQPQETSQPINPAENNSAMQKGESSQTPSTDQTVNSNTTTTDNDGTDKDSAAQNIDTPTTQPSEEVTNPPAN